MALLSDILAASTVRGERGPTATVSVGTTTVVTPATNPSVTNTGTSGAAIFAFSLPRQRTISIGTVTSGSAGASPVVTTSTDANGDNILNFTLPVAANTATLTGTETLTNKTLTAPVLSGTVTGTYTLGGTPTLSGTFAGTPIFSGFVDFSVGLDLTTTATPAVPAANDVRVFSRSIGGRTMPSALATTNDAFSFQPFIGRNKIAFINPEGNTTTVNLSGIAISTTGTATAVSVATTNIYTATRKIEYLAASASTAVAGFTGSALQYFIGGSGLGGFHLVMRFGPATGVTAANRRLFVGMTNSTSAPTDVNPSTLLNMIGVGYDTADTNFQFMSNAGTGTATKTDLGVNFPKPSADRTKMYELSIFCPPGATTISYTFQDLGTGSIASGTRNTNLPATTTLLTPRGYVSVGGTTSACGFGLTSLYVETDY